MIKFTSILLLVFSLITSNYHVLTNEPYSSENEIKKVSLESMIVPHHDLAEDIIDEMYKRISTDKTSILLISPDHFLDGDRKVTVSLKNWSTSTGRVLIDRSLSNKLLALDFVDQNDQEIYKEHGLSIHMPYIAKYFENADVVTMMISKETSVDELNQLLGVLPEELFIIASVDFSHYLDVETAYKKDVETLELLKRNKTLSLFRMNDAYFDSPGCLYLIRTYNKGGYNVYEHRNSFDYIGNGYVTTSYFTIGFE